MKGLKERKLPKSVQSKIAKLRDSDAAHLSLWQQISTADEGRLFPTDFVVCAVIQRSLALIEGFTLMIEQCNMHCAIPLLRLQVDSIMRLYACWLVDSPEKVYFRLLKGEPLGRYKSKSGHPMTDKYLQEEASKHYPWLSKVYQTTSGFVHLSHPHMLAPFTGFGEDGTANIAIGTKGGREWKEADMVEALDAFLEATRSLHHLCWSWLLTKQKGAERRKAKNG